jgi:eukaryotic-like serine/threonine-protein kinase
VNVTEFSTYAGFPPGTVLLDKYRIIRELGTGGMGVVMCAEHIPLGTQVAMKFLLPELALLPDASQRFIREARAATRIQSEHITRVLDFGTLPPEIGMRPSASGGAPPPPSGQPFIVMEYLEGKDLGRHLKAGRVFSIHEAIEYIVQASEAVALAHRTGIIHRDIKPANLFLTTRPDGSALVKVLDFGLSKLVEEAAQQNAELTKTTAVMGSALYMPQEQMRPTGTLDHRADIYALGVSLYELLTHTHPFTAGSFSELAVKVSLDPPDSLRRHRGDVPEELAALIAKAYARYPDDRFPSVGSFVAALAPFAAQETQATIETIQRFERTSTGELPMVRMLTPLTNQEAVTVQRPRRIPWAIIAIAVGVAIGTGTASWYWLSHPTVIASDTSDAGSSAEPRSPTPPESAPVIPIMNSAPLPSAPLPAPILSASAAVKAPASLQDCKKPGDFYFDPQRRQRRRCP